MIDKGVQALLDTGAWPNPNQPGTGAFGLGRNYLGSGNGGQNRDQWDAKLNWNPTSKLSMFVRFGMNQSSWTTGQLFGLLGGPTLSSANTAAGIGGAHVYSGTISGTYVFTAHVVGDAHFGYTRINSFSQQPNQDQNLGATLLQVPGLSTALETPYQQKNEGGMPTLNIDNFGVLGSPNNFQPQSYNDPNRNFDGNVSWIKGTHEIRGGFEADYIATNEMQYQQTGAPFDSGAGGFHFATGTTALNGGPAGNDFNSFAAFLLGLPQDSGKVYQFPPYMYTRTKTYGIYLRDKWQITPKLTVTFGGREEFYPFPVRAGTGTEIWSFNTNQLLICGVASTPTDCGVSSHKQRFVPRAGLAYRVGGSMVIRGGYAQVTSQTRQGPRWGIVFSYTFLKYFSQTRRAVDSLISRGGKRTEPAHRLLCLHRGSSRERQIQNRLRQYLLSLLASAGSLIADLMCAKELVMPKRRFHVSRTLELIPRAARFLPAVALTLVATAAWAQTGGATRAQLETQASRFFREGKYAEAAELEEQLVASSEKSAGPNSPHVAEDLINLGAAYRELGDTRRAETVLRRALQIDTQELGPESEDVARACNILGLVYRDRDDFAQAEPLLGRSLAIRQKILPANDPSIILSMGNLGDTLRALGRYLDAERMLKQALELQEAKSGKDDPSLIDPLNNLATLYSAKGDAEAASTAWERALAIINKSGASGELQTMVLYSNLGHLDLVRGRLPEGKERLDHALALARRLAPNSAFLASVLSNTVLLKMREGDPAGAARDSTEAVAIRERLQPDSAVLADALENLALSSWAAGNLEAALQAFTRATAIREVETPKVLAIGSPEQKEEFIRSQASTFDAVLTLQMSAFSDRAEAAGLAIRSVLFRKGLLLDTLSNETATLKNWPADDKPLADKLRELRSEVSTLWFSQRQSNDAFLKFEVRRALERELEGTLRSRNPEVRVVTPVPKIAEVQAALPPGSVFVDWVLVHPTFPNGIDPKSRYFCYAIAQDGHLFVVDEGPADEIDQRVTAFRRAIASKADQAQVKSLARELEKRLLEPLYSLLTDKTTLILSPDGQLSLLPFAALWNGEKYAAQRWTLSYVTSGRDLVRPASQVASRQADVVVADPAFGSVGEGKSAPPVGIFSDLPGALREGQAVHGVLPSSTLLTGSEATEEAIKNLHGPRILHLATHGFFLTTDGVSATVQSRGVNVAPRDSAPNYKYVDDPMLKSGIALARVNNGGSSQENGILTAMEVSDMDLGGTDLVVLSACDTGVGEAVVGDGVYGLRRAFAIAGARDAGTQSVASGRRSDRNVDERLLSGPDVRGAEASIPAARPTYFAKRRVQPSVLLGSFCFIRRTWAFAGFEFQAGGT